MLRFFIALLLLLLAELPWCYHHRDVHQQADSDQKAWGLPDMGKIAQAVVTPLDTHLNLNSSNNPVMTIQQQASLLKNWSWQFYHI